MANLGFGLMDVKPSTGENEIIPAGWYNAWITGDEFVDNSSKNGKLLKLRFEIISGFYKGNSFVENLNIIHSSPKTELIARADLSAITVATGAPNTDETSVLHKKPLKVKVKIEAYKNREGEVKYSNKPSAYRGIQEDIPTVETQIELILPQLHVAEAATLPVGAPIPAWTTPAQQTAPPAILGNAPVQPWQQTAPPVQQSVQESAPVQQAQVQQPAAPAWAPPLQPAAPISPQVQETAPAAPFDPNAKPAWMVGK